MWDKSDTDTFQAGTRPAETRLVAGIQAAPAALLAVGAGLLAALQGGSIAARDWLPYAVLAALLLLTCLLALRVSRPTRAATTTLVGFAGLALWAGISLFWTPLPTLGREEALLTLLYAIAFAIPAFTLATLRARLIALASVAAVAAGLAGVAAGGLLGVFSPSDLFVSGRLTYPVTYVNANAAVFLVGFWPAVALAARRDGAVVGRMLAFAAAAAVAGAWTVTQSKGGALALVASALLVAVVSPLRLRFLFFAVAGIAPAIVLFSPLTGPFRADGEAAVATAANAAGRAIIVAAGAGLVLGAILVLIDRVLDLSGRPRRVVSVLAAIATITAVLAGALAGYATWGDPRDETRDAWAEFKHLPSDEVGGSHFVNLGSSRYDFWQVALATFEREPLVGSGARGFAAEYLRYGKSIETPARAHSLPLDILGENGVVGFALLLLIVVPPLAVAVRRRGHLTAVAAGAGAAYWLVHAAGDWTWSFPALGIPFAILLGIAVAPDEERPIPRTPRRALAVAALAAAFLFVPPLLSERLVFRSLLRGGPSAESDLSWARRLDPISVSPLVTEARIAPNAATAIPPLERAVAKEPRSAAIQFQLGFAYLQVGRKRDARTTLLRAQELYPRSERIQSTLREVGVK